jgi:acyl-coenzyme A thioesterase PaaI-like protein
LKPGRRLAVVEAQVWAEEGGREALVAKLNATMAVVTQR